MVWTAVSRPLFEWDAAKADANWRKHGVRFETAMRVFADPFALIEQDRIEVGEYRWRATGSPDAGATLLVVAHVWRGDRGEEVIRIISARRADRAERRRYEADDSPA